MNQNEINELFNTGVSTILDCCDTTITTQQDEVIERGMCLFDEVCFSYVLEEGIIRLYVGNKEVIKFDENSPVLLAFKALLSSMEA